MTHTARLLALLIFVAAVTSLVAQGIVSSRLVGAAGTAQVIWVMSAYFTVLTNLVVATAYGRVALSGRVGSAGWHGGLLLWIITVGLIYHTLLAGIWSPQGLGWWADQGLHSATPLLVLVWWLAFAPKSPLTPRHPLLWSIFPLAYCVYVLVRGQITGTYPYPFIDVAALGPARTAMNVAGLTLGFGLAGFGLLAVARRLNHDNST